MLNRVMVALDNMDRQEIFDFLSREENTLSHVKIGLEQYLRYGRSFVEEIHRRFSPTIFLDLKLHDIPNTVSRAIASLEKLPIEFLTLHLSGGEEMLKAALKSVSEHAPKLKLLGVSYLTSLDQEDLQELWNIPVNEQPQAFKQLFALAARCRIPGLILSASELALASEVEKQYGWKFVKVCPGIRFNDEIAQNKVQDQKRVFSPQSAFSKGADYLVMGRSLTTATNLEQRLSELNSLSAND